MAKYLNNLPHNTTEYPNSFERQGAFPLERYSVFTNKADAIEYATNNKVAYVGQPIAVTDSDNKTVDFYLIVNNPDFPESLFKITSTELNIDAESINRRLESIEEFFARLDGEFFDKALNTLIEVQDRINLIYDDKDEDGNDKEPTGLLVDEINRAIAAERVIYDADSATGLLPDEIARAIASEEKEARERETADNIVYDADGNNGQPSGLLVDEINRAVTAETLIEENLNKEINRSTLKENTLSEQISNETQRAKDAEGTNATAIVNEATRATTAEAGLNTAIQAEVARAEAIEADHKKRIETMELFWKAAEADGTDKTTIDTLKEIQEYIVSDETGAAQMAANISQNKDDIEAEKNRAIAAEKAIYTPAEGEILASGYLQDEINRARQAETDLKSYIDGQVSALNIAFGNYMTELDNLIGGNT